MTTLQTALAEAEVYRAQVRAGLSQGEVAARVGVRRPLINKRLALLDVDAEAVAALEAGQLGVAHLYALCRLRTAASQRRLASLAAQRGWSVRQLERAVIHEVGARRPALRHWPGAHPDVVALAQLLEDELGRTIGMPVRVRALRGNRVEFSLLAQDAQSAWALAAHFGVTADEHRL